MGDILNYYVKLVDFMANMMGEDCEVVLQDCRKQSQSIVAISNGHISGRSVGAPLTDYGLKIIADGHWKTRDWDVNYQGRTQSGKTLICSTFFIKEKNELVGMLCFNSDPSRYIQMSRDLLKMGGITWDTNVSEDKEVQTMERFANSIPDMIYGAADETFGIGNYVRIDHLNQDERLRLLENLEQKGVFQLKGAVSEVASHLGCSEASMYRYLSKIAKMKKEKQKEKEYL